MSSGNFFNLVKACLSLFSASFQPCLTLFAALFEPCSSLFHLGCAFFFAVFADGKKRVPGAIGLIRTGDTIQYANMILVSG